MKKICVFILCCSVLLMGAAPLSLIGETEGVHVTLSETEMSQIYSYRVPTVELESSGEYSHLNLGGLPTLAKSGEPMLPYIPLRIAVPAGKRIKDISIIIEHTDTTCFQQPITPAPEYGVDPISVDIEINREIYESGAVWPLEQIRAGGILRKQGHDIAAYQLFPLLIDFATNTIISARSLKVEVTFESKTSSRNSEGRALTRRTLSQRELRVENSPASGTMSRFAGSAQYLVITADSLSRSSKEYSLETLLAIHRENGLSTKIITVETISGSYEGVDLQEKIRNAIIDHYNREGTEYVLLAGDTPIIPERLLWLDEAPSTFNKGVPSDLYYACLDGTFNSDGDEKWGERNDGIDGAHPDHFAEVHVGRFSVENGEELSNIVEKTVTHLTESSSGSILLAGEKLGFGGVSEYAKPSLEELWSGGEANGYLTRSFGSEPDLIKETIYAEQFSDKKWKDTSIIPLINNNSIGIINHIGHGYANVNLRIYTNSKNLDLIRNSKPIFVFSQACLSGSFQKESISEYLTTGTKHGMWGGIWNSDNGLGAYESTDSPSQFMNRHFWHGYFGRDMNRAGELLSYMHESAYDESINNWAFRWSSYITNLQGDPAAHFNLRGETALVELDPIGTGNRWDRGHSFEITWYDNVKTDLTLELYQNGTFVQTIESGIADIQSYNWTINEDIPTGDGYYLRLSSGNSASMSEKFSIDPKSELTLVSPQMGDTLLKGSTAEIIWGDNLKESVSLLLLYKGEVWDTIASDISPELTLYSWDIPLSVSHDSAYSIAVASSVKEWLTAKNEGEISICSPLENSYPFSDEFEDYSQGTTIGFWSQRSDDSFDWAVRSGPTPSRVKADDWWNITGPNSDASGSGNYIYCEATGHEGGKSAGLISAPFDIEGLVEGTLSFKVHMYNKEDNGNMGNLSLYLLIDGESHRVINMTGSKGDKWISKEVDLSPYRGAKVLQAYFKMRTGKSFASDIAIDEFSIDCRKEAVSIISSGIKAAQPFLVTPQIVTTEKEVVVQFPQKSHMKEVEYKLFDVVGNCLISGIAALTQGNSGRIGIPSSLSSGSYLLICRVKSGKTEIYKTIIGKKE